MSSGPNHVSYYAQNPDFEQAVLQNRDLSRLRCHTFPNVGLEFPEFPWDELLSVGAAHIDHTGLRSCLASLICGRMDKHIEMYLAALPAGLLLRGRPTMERVMDLWFTEERDRALAALSDATGFGQVEPGGIDILRSPSTLTEAAFFCAVYHPDNAHLDYLLGCQRFTLYQKLTLYRMAGREDDFIRTYRRATAEVSEFDTAFRVAEAAGRLSMQYRDSIALECQYGGADIVEDYQHFRERAKREARSAAEWCRMATLDSMYRHCTLSYSEPWQRGRPYSGIHYVREHLEHAEQAARCSTDWRICGQAIACCLGDCGRAEQCFARAESDATTTLDLLCIFRLRRRDGIGSPADWTRIVERAEDMAVHSGDWSECADAWRDIGNVDRYRFLRRRLYASSADDDAYLDDM